MERRSKERFNNLRLLLRSICLRRTTDLLGLPKPDPQNRYLDLSPSEREEYNAIQEQCRREIDMAVSGRGKGRLNSTVLESLLKLRLFCNNGSSGRGTSTPDDFDEDMILSYLQQNDEADCVYCSHPVYSINDARDTDGSILIAGCLHLVCRSCIPTFSEKKQCPQCASLADERVIPDGIQRADCQRGQGVRLSLPSRNRYPSKLLAFLDDISTQTSHKRYVKVLLQTHFS